MQAKAPSVPELKPLRPLAALLLGKPDLPQASCPQAPPSAEALPQQQYLAAHIDDFCDCI